MTNCQKINVHSNNFAIIMRESHNEIFFFSLLHNKISYIIIVVLYIIIIVLLILTLTLQMTLHAN